MTETEHRGAFRVRPDKGGALQVWAPGWRLEAPVVALLPLVLALGVTLTGIGPVASTALCVPLIGCAFVLLRLTRMGILFDAWGIELTGVVRSRRVSWDQVGGFMGHRTAHDGWAVLVTSEGQRIRVPGQLSGEEMNPIGDEGDLSAVDQLNRMIDTFRRQVPSARLPERPRTRGRAPRPGRSATPAADAAGPRRKAASRPPRLSRAERKAALNPPPIRIPEVEPMSPGARRLAEMERREAEEAAAVAERNAER